METDSAELTGTETAQTLQKTLGDSGEMGRGWPGSSMRSSARMLLQMATHSLQTKWPGGPAISLATCSWDLLQNEHRGEGTKGAAAGVRERVQKGMMPPVSFAV